MNNKDVLDFETELQAFMNDVNEQDLRLLIDELQKNHYPNVISKAEKYRETYRDNPDLVHMLWKVSAISHAEIREYHLAKEIISKLYDDNASSTLEDLVTLGQMAFMCDYKLARRIMSDAIKKTETMDDVSPEVVSGIYLILGESEENLDKPKRALKYYKKGLESLDAQSEAEPYIKMFLAFKIGMLHTTLKEHDASLEYLKRSLTYADEKVPQLKANVLVSIGQIYGSLDRGEEGYPYLKEALQMLPNSDLENSYVHMEALLETGYYHYRRGDYEKGVDVYDMAIQMYTASHQTDPRKLGMMYMQYSYCLAHISSPDNKQASIYYEKAISQLEKENDIELLHSALTDVIAFFDQIGNKSKQQYYESKMLRLAEKANMS